MKKNFFIFTVIILCVCLFCSCNKQDNNKQYNFPEIKPFSIDGINSVEDFTINNAFYIGKNAEIADIDYQNQIVLIKNDGKYNAYDFNGQKLTSGNYLTYEKIFDKYCLYGEEYGAIFSLSNKAEKKFNSNNFIALNNGYYLLKDGTKYRIQLFDKNDVLIKILYDAETQYEAVVCDNFLIYNNRKLNVLQLYDLNDNDFTKEFPNTGYAKLYYLGQGYFIFIDTEDENIINYIYNAPKDELKAVNYNVISVFNEYNTADIAFNSPYSLIIDDKDVYITDYLFEQKYLLDGTNLSFIDGYSINDSYSVDEKVYVTKLKEDFTPEVSEFIFNNCSEVRYNDGVFVYNKIQNDEVLYGAINSNGEKIYSDNYGYISLFINGYSIAYKLNEDVKTYYRLKKDGTLTEISDTIDDIHSFFYVCNTTDKIKVFSFGGELKTEIDKQTQKSEIKNVNVSYLGGYFTVDDYLYLIKIQ